MIYFLSLLLLLTLPFQFAIPFPWVGDVPLARIIAATIIGLFLIRALFRRSFRLPEPVFVGLIGSFLFLSLASVFWASRYDLAIPKIVFFLNLFPLVFVWHDLSERHPEKLRSLCFVTAIGAAGAAIIAIAFFVAQFFFGVSTTYHFVLDRAFPFFLGHDFSVLVREYPSLLVNLGGETVLRATALFPDPHVAAYFFGLSGFLALGLSRVCGRPVYLWLAAILFLADLLTFSRGGLVGLLAGSAVSIIIASGSSWPIKIQLRTAILGGTMLLVFLSPPVLNRFLTSFSFTDTSSTERIMLWKEAVGIIKENPGLGLGLGNYLSTVRPLYDPEAPFYAHSLYLDIAAEIGLLGLSLLFGVFFWIGRRVALTRRSDLLAAPLAGAVTLYLAHSFVETPIYSIHVTIVLVLYFVLALSLGRRPAW